MWSFLTTVILCSYITFLFVRSLKQDDEIEHLKKEIDRIKEYTGLDSFR